MQQRHRHPRSRALHPLIGFGVGFGAVRGYPELSEAVRGGSRSAGTVRSLIEAVRGLPWLSGAVRDLFKGLRSCSGHSGLFETSSRLFGVIRGCSRLVRGCSELFGVVWWKLPAGIVRWGSSRALFFSNH